MRTEAEREYRVDIAGVSYGMDKIESGEISQSLFDELSVGNTVCAELRLTLWPDEAPPRMGSIRPYVRDVGESKWTPLGIFWIDQRVENGPRMEITAYDGMMKSEAVWTPEQSLRFPMTMEQAARHIAGLMGTSLDERCQFNGGYTVDYPANEYTLREVLGYIAAAHGGNWIVTAEGKLLLVPLFGAMPAETSWLVDEDGAAITMGGVKLLV